MDYINQIMRSLLLLPPQASSIAKQIDWLHYAVISVTMVGTLALTLVGVIFCIRYRQPAHEAIGQRREPAPTPSLSAEILIIGALFALFAGFWGVGFWQYVKIASPPAGTYDVYVSGKQWMWKFAYPDGSHTIDTLYVPAKQPVRLIMTSRDVIHSFFVPDFRVKHDAVPGRYTTVWFTADQPGTHRIFCAEYCGTWHSRMMGQVAVLTPSDFQRWQHEGSRERPYPLDPDARDWQMANEGDQSLVEQGERAAAKYGCLRCHSVDGSAHIGPTWVGLYESQVPLEDGDNITADVAYITESMMDPQAKLHRGFGKIMPSYVGYLQPPEVSAIVEYIKSLKTLPPNADPQSPLPLATPATLQQQMDLHQREPQGAGQP